MTDRALTILLTNDDGVDSAGIVRLREALLPRYRVVTAAPAREQSGVSHAFTFNAPLNVEQHPPVHGMPVYAIHGTPSDCVKFAVSYLLPVKPDAVVSGMNLGENSGISGFYSGTVAAAREGAFWQIPSIAFSLCSGGSAYLEPYCRQAALLLERILAASRNGFDNPRNRTFFNVNFPACAPEQNRGIRVTRQSTAFFDDRYRVVEDAQGRQSYQLYGDKQDLESTDGYDSRALMSGFTAVTPLDCDSTADEAIGQLRGLEQ